MEWLWFPRNNYFFPGGPTFSGYSRWLFGSAWPACVVLIPLPTTPNLPSVGLFSQTVFGVLRPGRTDCNYTWTTCALQQDPVFCDQRMIVTWGVPLPFSFYMKGAVYEETPPVKKCPPDHGLQRNAERHNNCEAIVASQFVEVSIGL